MWRVDERRLPFAAELFYEAAVEPDLWGDVLAKVSDVFAAEGSALLGHTTLRSGSIATEGLIDFTETFFREGWGPQNPWPEAMARKRLLDVPVTEWMLFSAEELNRLPIYNELTRPKRLDHSLAAILTSEGGMTSLNIGRRPSQGPFDANEVRAMARILPELRRASRLATRLMDAREAGIGDLLEGMNQAAVLIDAGGNVRRMNAAASRLFTGIIEVSSGQLVTIDPAANSELRGKVRRAIRKVEDFHSESSRVVVRRPGGRPIVAEVVPLPRAEQSVFGAARAIIFFSDLGSTISIEEEVCRNAFGLTPAEAKLAVAIAQGLDLQSYAQTFRVSIETARTRLKSVLAKTDTRRQAELAVLIGRVVRLFGGRR